MVYFTCCHKKKTSSICTEQLCRHKKKCLLHKSTHKEIGRFEMCLCLGVGTLSVL